MSIIKYEAKKLSELANEREIYDMIDKVAVHKPDGTVREDKAMVLKYVRLMADEANKDDERIYHDTFIDLHGSGNMAATMSDKILNCDNQMNAMLNDLQANLSKQNVTGPDKDVNVTADGRNMNGTNVAMNVPNPVTPIVKVQAPNVNVRAPYVNRADIRASMNRTRERAVEELTGRSFTEEKGRDYSRDLPTGLLE